jgi:hypothetical protein
MKERYDTNFHPVEEAIWAVEVMREKGHHVDTASGDCRADCPFCQLHDVTPGQEYGDIVEMLKKEIEEATTKDSNIEMMRSINRTRLQALAKHPMAHVTRADKNDPPVIVKVSVTIEHEGRSATASVYGLRPIQGKEEAYTEGFEQDWSEKTSEGVDPHTQPKVKP